MQTLEKGFHFTTEVNRSKFIVYIVPISDFYGLQKKLKKENPKANHVVYALRYLNEFDQIVENSSDDGEPKGCAGVPILNILRGEALINCAVLVVRYFGGIKLGMGGMARAYSLSFKNLLEKVALIIYEKEESYSFSSSYRDIDKVLYQLKKLGILKYERNFGIQEVVWKLFSSPNKLNNFKEN